MCFYIVTMNIEYELVFFLLLRLMRKPVLAFRLNQMYCNGVLQIAMQISNTVVGEVCKRCKTRRKLEGGGRVFLEGEVV